MDIKLMMFIFPIFICHTTTSSILKVIVLNAVSLGSSIVTRPRTDPDERSLAPASGERQPRSLFSLFFDGFRNVHDKLHDQAGSIFFCKIE